MTIRGWLAAGLIALLAILSPVRALGDVLILKNGERYEGTVKSEGEDYIFFTVKVGSVQTVKMFSKLDIKELQRDSDAKDSATTTPTNMAPANPGNAPKGSEALAIPPGAVKIAFVSLGNQENGQDMVGPYINGDGIKESAKILRELPKDQRPTIVVLTIDSGGGAVSAIEGIMEGIEELKKDFRVVAWIKSAISGAAFTAMNCEEIYFMTSGHLGGNVAFSTSGGKATAMKGQGLNWILEIGEKVSRNGRLDPAIMRAMQIFGELTADIDENGDVTWYWRGEDEDAEGKPRGKYLVKAEKMILTFNAVDALRYKVSKGTADSKDELARLLGASEWVEVGQKAEEHQVNRRAITARADQRLQVEFSKFQIALKFATSARSQQERGAKIGEARRHLRAMKQLIQDVPWWFEGMGLNEDWFRERERELDDLAKS